MTISIDRQLSIMLILMIMTGVLSQAQGEVTPEVEPSPIITPTASEMPTSTLTFVPTPTPVPTATDEPIATSTFEPSLTPTEFSVATPTAEASSTVEPTTETPFEAETSSATVTATMQGIATETSTIEITPSIISTLEPFNYGVPYDIIWFETFDSPDLLVWQPTNTWLREYLNGNWYLTTSHDSPLTFLYELDNAAITLKVSTLHTVYLSIRDDYESQYTFALTPEGQATLYKSNQIIATTMVAPAIPGIWRNIGLGAVGNRIVVGVDGHEILFFDDPIPLIAGFFTIATDEGTISIDEIEIAVPHIVPVEMILPSGMIQSMQVTQAQASFFATTVEDTFGYVINPENILGNILDTRASIGNTSDNEVHVACIVVGFSGSFNVIPNVTEIQMYADTITFGIVHRRQAKIYVSDVPLGCNDPGWTQILDVDNNAWYTADTPRWRFAGKPQQNFRYVRFSAHKPAHIRVIRVDNAVFSTNPESSMSLTLDIDHTQLSEPRVEPYIFQIGEMIPILAQIEAAGDTNISDTIGIELTVPRALRPVGMTIQDEDPITLAQIFDVLICYVTGGSNCGDLLNDILQIVSTNETIIYIYDITDGVMIGQPFPIMLEVIGELEGTFTISGHAYVVDASPQAMTSFSEPEVGLQQVTSAGTNVANSTLDITVEQALTPTPECLVRLIAYDTYEEYPANNLQVLMDMLILPAQDDSSGLIQLLENPTINARKVGTSYTWGNFFTVYSRISFTQTANGQDDEQIWYQVSSTDVSEPEGWMPIRYNGRSYLTVMDPCFDAPSPSTFTFTYDRRAAANYAIEHSYNTATRHSELQNQGRVTERISTIDPLPYAYFSYSGIGQAQFVTGSAVFVSESLWMGGMPMTYGNRGSYTDVPPADSCLQAGGETRGWRYCFTDPAPQPPKLPFGNASNPFDTHGDLVGYWTNGPSVIPNNVLASKGRQMLIGQGSNEQYIRGRTSLLTDLNSPSSRLINLGEGTVTNAAALSNRILELLTSNPLNVTDQGTYRVQRGDYVFLKPVDPETGLPNTQKSEHGLVVLGWQSAMSCNQAIFNNSDVSAGYRRWEVDNFAQSHSDAQTLSIANPVPWVADFTAPPNGNSLQDATQSPVPRPFYCTIYFEPDPPAIAGTDRFYPHDWYFYIMPDQLTVTTTLALNQLYVDPAWHWAASQ